MSNNTELRGVARNVQIRQERFMPAISSNGQERTREVCSVRLERFDHEGNALAPVAIEIRSGSGFAGDLTEGDHIAVYDRKRGRSGAIETNAVRNVTTGGVFGDRNKVNGRWWGKVDVPPSGG
jgi:hypothetical protein